MCPCGVAASGGKTVGAPRGGPKRAAGRSACFGKRLRHARRQIIDHVLTTIVGGPVRTCARAGRSTRPMALACRVGGRAFGARAARQRPAVRPLLAKRSRRRRPRRFEPKARPGRHIHKRNIPKWRSATNPLTAATSKRVQVMEIIRMGYWHEVCSTMTRAAIVASPPRRSVERASCLGAPERDTSDSAPA